MCGAHITQSARFLLNGRFSFFWGGEIGNYWLGFAPYSRVLKKIPVNKGAGMTGGTGGTRVTRETGIPVLPVFPVFLGFPLGRPAPAGVRVTLL